MSTVALPRYLGKEGVLEWVVGRAVIVGPAVVQRLFIGYYTLIELWAHALLHDSHDSHALATSEAPLEVLLRPLACEFKTCAEPFLVIGAMVWGWRAFYGFVLQANAECRCWWGSDGLHLSASESTVASR